MGLVVLLDEHDPSEEMFKKTPEELEKSGYRIYKNGVYNRTMTELHKILPLPENSDGTFEIPEGVKRIMTQVCIDLKGLRRLIIPKSVEEIGFAAFSHCSDLEYADIHAKTIDWRAFTSCNKLKEVRLHDGLEKIGDEAFAYTDIKKLSLPPSVRDIGHDILYNADPLEQTLEIYLNNGALPKSHGLPAENGTLLIARSPETNEIVCEFVILGKITRVFTPNGIDFTEYDKIFHKTFSQGNAFRNGFKAAEARLRCPFGMDAEKRRYYEEYIAFAASLVLLDIITKRPGVSVGEITDDFTNSIYFGLVDEEGLLKLIDASARAENTELTAFLMQKLREKKRDQ